MNERGPRWPPPFWIFLIIMFGSRERVGGASFRDGNQQAALLSGCAALSGYDSGRGSGRGRVLSCLVSCTSIRCRTGLRFPRLLLDGSAAKQVQGQQRFSAIGRTSPEAASKMEEPVCT